jgi:hypothetical protein
MPPTRDRSGVMSRYLKRGEQVVDTVRVTSRGTVMMSALLAGAGAAAGYMASTVLATGPLAAAVGAGAGAGVGMLIGSMLANLRTRRTTGTRGAALTIALTRQRMLFFRSAWLSNRAADLVREVPLPSVASVVVGRARLISPHPVTITLTDGRVLEFEAARIEKPEQFGAAFRKTTGR